MNLRRLALMLGLGVIAAASSAMAHETGRGMRTAHAPHVTVADDGTRVAVWRVGRTMTCRSRCTSLAVSDVEFRLHEDGRWWYSSEVINSSHHANWDLDMDVEFVKRSHKRKRSLKGARLDVNYVGRLHHTHHARPSNSYGDWAYGAKHFADLVDGSVAAVFKMHAGRIDQPH